MHQYNHQQRLSVNSVQSLVEPITPPSANNRNHTKNQSLDLSEFNPNQLSFVSDNKNASKIVDYSFFQAPPFEIEPNNPNLKNGNSTPSLLCNNNIKTTTQSSNLDIHSIPLLELDYVKLATDQYGCRFLQKKLESPSESMIVKDVLYEQIKPIILDLMLDPFGNYLIQKLSEYINSSQRSLIIQSIYPHVFQLSINQYGTRSFQKIIDTIDNEAQIDMIIKGFEQEYTTIKQIVTLINDLNGNHVIQKCILKFPTSKFNFIINAMVHEDNIIAISTHKHGCCVLQKLLSVSTLQQFFKISIKIVEYLPNLINDQFGNYIIQFLLDVRELDFYLVSEIYKKIELSLCQLSRLKFSSNVIEKFIKKIYKVMTSYIIPRKESSSNTSDDLFISTVGILFSIIDLFTNNLSNIIRDNYGNYVLQTLLDVRNYSEILKMHNVYSENEAGPLYDIILEFSNKIDNLFLLTKDFLPSIKTTSYAKKIKMKIKLYAELKGVNFTELMSKDVGSIKIQNGKILKANAFMHDYQNDNLDHTKKDISNRSHLKNNSNGISIGSVTNLQIDRNNENIRNSKSNVPSKDSSLNNDKYVIMNQGSNKNINNHIQNDRYIFSTNDDSTLLAKSMQNFSISSNPPVLFKSQSYAFSADAQNKNAIDYRVINRSQSMAMPLLNNVSFSHPTILTTESDKVHLTRLSNGDIDVFRNSPNMNLYWNVSQPSMNQNVNYGPLASSPANNESLYRHVCTNNHVSTDKTSNSSIFNLN
ncbi:hypothetical protein Kpol_541p44 [Vanderwaltozyma polyspora DSM 70294]|uniref:PUM-HD domain-containing protein n=1 Tax=Vanderwaltozyma polyspora (strain ATCC 22028 / DSM 70294 / BCRC 21397 / CBS 2163 / NBRC 10782 / NRRL Y-8283 / UCD 57-17) TaxID=436907 RepID=A7TIZ0_VANPO|nr:uncharacterized protein Kpol_541p44 [Vanderwaltozyma polyspora DSM 70294]EDO17802.1 hypothetical protein Kpol_541p44 [Vanderwaltozyma polyspora DSM 70294]